MIDIYSVSVIGSGIIAGYNVLFGKGKNKEKKDKLFFLIFLFFIILKLLKGGN